MNRNAILYFAKISYIETVSSEIYVRTGLVTIYFDKKKNPKSIERYEIQEFYFLTSLCFTLGANKLGWSDVMFTQWHHGDTVARSQLSATALGLSVFTRFKAWMTL